MGYYYYSLQLDFCFVEQNIVLLKLFTVIVMKFVPSLIELNCEKITKLLLWVSSSSKAKQR